MDSTTLPMPRGTRSVEALFFNEFLVAQASGKITKNIVTNRVGKVLTAGIPKIVLPSPSRFSAFTEISGCTGTNIPPKISPTIIKTRTTQRRQGLRCTCSKVRLLRRTISIVFFFRLVLQPSQCPACYGQHYEHRDRNSSEQ